MPPIDPSGPIGGILTFLRKNFAPYRPRGLYFPHLKFGPSFPRVDSITFFTKFVLCAKGA